MFSIGDCVVYPYHGAGRVEKIEEKEILGNKLLYFVVYFPLNQVTLMLPENKIGESGLRPVITKKSSMMSWSLYAKKSKRERRLLPQSLIPVKMKRY